MENQDENRKEPEWKISGRVSHEFFVEFDAWAKKLRLTKSQLANMCLQAGFKQVVRAVSPEDSFQIEKLAELLREVTRQEDLEKRKV